MRVLSQQQHAVEKGVIPVSEAQKGFSGVGKWGKGLATHTSAVVTETMD